MLRSFIRKCANADLFPFKGEGEAMSSPLEVFSDLSERLHYNLPDFPLYVHKDQLHRYGFAAACHWHPDLEFILALKGGMDFFVNGKVVKVNAPNGIFVNSKRLHYGFSTDGTDCGFIALVISPALLSAHCLAVKQSWDGMFGPDAEDFIDLSLDVDWQKSVLNGILRICEEMHSESRNPFKLIALAAGLCADVGGHVQQDPKDCMDARLQMMLWTMTQFIHTHFGSKLTIDDIASSGALCRSKCHELFKKHTGQTPNTYLNRCRIANSCEMLRDSDRTICEIALSCGFQSASYFSHVFRKETGLSPQDYRRQNSH
jgi:AraC-like DNA-binding protein